MGMVLHLDEQVLPFALTGHPHAEVRREIVAAHAQRARPLASVWQDVVPSPPENRLHERLGDPVLGFE